jgi:DNA end-binding protein Ku
MRAIWSGALSFGLVNIPIKLYSATAGTGLNFDMLHKKDLSPIRYARVCRADGKEIPYEDIIKGYEYRKGDYVVLSEDDFKKANARKTQSIDIQDFTEESQIDSIYFEKPYFLEPEKGSEKAYVLLREALKKSDKVGIAKYVLRKKERLGAIKPFGKALILNQLRFSSELRKLEGLNLPESAETKSREIDMALSLIDQLTENFKPEEYKDTYQEELMKVIEARALGKKVRQKESAPEPTEVEDLVSALKASLEKEKEKERIRK